MHFRIKIFLPSMIAIILVSNFVLAASSTSDTTDTQVGITGGALLVTPPQVTSDFGSHTLNGQNQVIVSDLSVLTVGDATGTGEGWSVGVQATTFEDETGNKIPSGSFVLSNVGSVTAVGGTTSPSPTVIGSSWTLDNGSQKKILSAAVGEGVGTYEIAFPIGALSLSLVASTKVDNSDSNSLYKSVVTWTITKSP